jgi:hypothetical protein
MKLNFFIFLFLGAILIGCQTTPGVVITETTLPVKQSRMAIRSALGEARVVSQNGREISTYYHDRNLKFLDVTPKTRIRYYTKVMILGARRPYDINVEVRVEQRDPDTKIFQDIGLNERLSLIQAKAVQQALNQSRDKSQVIDDGAPF